MRVIIFTATVLFLFGITNQAFSQNGQDNSKKSPKTSEIVNPRIDNMGYWMKMAEMGLVPYNANVPVKPAEYKGSLIEVKGVSVVDSPDIPVTNLTNVTESENSVFIDPDNNQYILNSNNSTSWSGGSVGTLYGANYFQSANGGTTWGGSYNGAGGSNSGDPTTAIGRNGRQFVNYISNAGGQGVAYSDNGSTWSTATVGPNPGSLADKNHMWIDNCLTSPYSGYLYTAWTDFGGSYNYQVVFSRSTNNGVTWSTRVPISGTISTFDHGVNLQTGPNGEVYACWATYPSSGLTEDGIGYAKSTNGGSTFSTAVKAISNIKGIRETGVLKNMRVNSFPSMAVDISGGANNGNIYIVWTNIGTPGINTGTNKSVYMSKSTNGGTSWSTAVKVNQGAFTNGKEAYSPWITCDIETGALAVVFYDDRNTSSTACETWVAYSLDAGATWTDFRVSDVSFTPNAIPGLASSYMGDYLGITSKGGMVYPCWTDTRNGLYMTYVSPFTLGLNAAFTANSTNICTAGAVTFTDQSSGPPTSWSWSFTGGSPSTYIGQYPPAITYSTPGIYNVSLTVSNGSTNDTETKTGYINVSNVIADFTGTPTTVVVGNTVTFTDNSSCSPTSWSWTFTGGTPSTATGPGPHIITYNTVGTYNVALTVTKASSNDTETKTGYINVITAVFNMTNATITTCSGNFYDSGGSSGSYTDNENFTETFYPATSGAKIRFIFSSFSTESGYDYLRIYDGINTSATLIGTYNGTTGPGTVTATNASGALTFNFTSDYSVTSTGWAAAISCYSTALPPVANFSANNLTPFIGQTVTFTDLSTNTPTSWSWSFSPATVTYVGGTSSASQNPQVQFNASGPYNVTLTATNAFGSDPEAKTAYINVKYAPVANFSANNTTPNVGQTVTFTDLSTNTPTSWSWTFNPATVTYVGGTTSASQNPQVQFNAQGLYTVSLTASNGSGPNTMTKTNYINALPIPPVANFMASNTTPFIGATVSFTDQSTNTPTSWLWAFTPSTVTYVGGTTSASQNPQVQFNAGGLYTVALTATNAGGSNTLTKTNYINAQGIPPVATLKLGTVTNPAPGTVLVPVTLEAINNPMTGNNLISSWSWYIAYDASRLYNAAPMTPANLTNYDAQFPSGNYVTNIIENNPAPGWNTIAVVYSAAVSGTGSVGMKFFDFVFTYTPGTTVCPNIFWTSTPGSASIDYVSNMADDYGNEFVLTLIDGCVWTEPPVTDFVASTTIPSVGETVNFTDMSTNYPTSWSWVFTPSTITYAGGTSSSSQNPQVQFNDEGNYTVQLTSVNEVGNDTEIKADYIVVSTSDLNLALTLLLEGPFDGVQMTPSLNGILPLSQPYTGAPWNYAGTESVASIPNPNVVDWILIELRDAATAALATGATAIARQAAFVQSDGTVIGIDGLPGLHFTTTVSNNLFVVIYHHNHLSIMSSVGLTKSGGVYTYNFSTGSGQVYGGTDGHKELPMGYWGMTGGDGDHDGTIGTTDYSPVWENEAGESGYLESDYNLDMQSDNIDKDDIWLPNSGKGTQVPN